MYISTLIDPVSNIQTRAYYPSTNRSNFSDLPLDVLDPIFLREKKFRLLEIACGSKGLFTKLLSDQGVDVCGIDPNLHHLHQTSQILFRRSAELNGFNNGTFDIAFSRHGPLSNPMENRDVQIKIIAETMRTLKPNGYLIVSPFFKQRRTELMIYWETYFSDSLRFIIHPITPTEIGIRGDWFLLIKRKNTQIEFNRNNNPSST